MLDPATDPKRLALHAVEDAAELPASGAARFIQLIAAIVLALAVYFLLSDVVKNVSFVIGGFVSAGVLFSVASLYQNVFDIRTLMLRRAYSEETVSAASDSVGSTNA